ncbi:MAG: hypothetical protein K2L49_03055 [Muribaculaceae bacterium]|nr:hypothetical protein [Muribaculaceae bacterium]
MQRYKRSRGFGVHSPFAFHFILRVLMEKAPYYCYPQLVVRRRVALGLLADAGGHRDVISVKCMKMLLRLSAWFRPRRVLVLGDDCGLAVTSLLAASSSSTAVTTGGDGVTGMILRPLAPRTTVAPDIASAIDAYGAMTESSFVLVNGGDCPDLTAATAAAAMAVDAGGVVVFRSLDAGAGVMEQWNRLSESMTCGMTFSNGKTGIIVARKHLPRQDFALWF